MFSPLKLLILVLLLIAIWFLYRAIKRRGVSGLFRGPQPTSAAQPKALEMEKCRICGDFVPADSRACAQSRCPYPAA